MYQILLWSGILQQLKYLWVFWLELANYSVQIYSRNMCTHHNSLVSMEPWLLYGKEFSFLKFPLSCALQVHVTSKIVFLLFLKLFLGVCFGTWISNVVLLIPDDLKYHTFLLIVCVLTVYKVVIWWLAPSLFLWASLDFKELSSTTT